MRFAVWFTFIIGIFGWGLALPVSADEAPDVDILLRNGTIYDGTTRPSFRGDVAILGDHITAVGDVGSLSGKLVLDCSGLIIAPGFIDVHTHSDGPIINRRTRANMNFLTQGCTTVVTGNCGAGRVDVKTYYDQIDAYGAGTNVAHLIPHGSLRSHVMGTAYRPPNPAEFERLLQLTKQSMEDGAWGISTGLVYVPSSYADTAELVRLSKVVAEAGGIYVSHIRDEEAALLTAINEALEIGSEAGLPVHISHLKASGREAWGLVRRAAEMIEVARANGQMVTADQYPYIASSTSLDATLIPIWARSGGRNSLLARFDDPSTSARIRLEMRVALKRRNNGETIRIARYGPRQEWVGKTLLQIAIDEKKPPEEIAIEIARGGGALIVDFMMNEDDVRYLLKFPWMATASDGRAYVRSNDQPHPRSYGTFPRKIGYFAMREKLLSLAQAIHSCSGLPAEIMGMTDRGFVKPNMYADLVVFDPYEFIDRATYDDPHQYSSGVVHVLVNGRPAILQRQATGELPGRAIRKRVKAAVAHTSEAGE